MLDEDGRPIMGDEELIITQEQEPTPKSKLRGLNPKTWNQEFVWGNDKLLHFLAGLAGTFGILLFVADNKNITKATVAIMGTIAICVLLAYSKEVWDSLGNGQADIWDLFCGIVGLMIAVVVFALYLYSRWYKSSDSANL